MCITFTHAHMQIHVNLSLYLLCKDMHVGCHSCMPCPWNMYNIKSNTERKKEVILQYIYSNDANIPCNKFSASKKDHNQVCNIDYQEPMISNKPTKLYSDKTPTTWTIYAFRDELDKLSKSVTSDTYPLY